jgi:hypothetical protein
VSVTHQVLVTIGATTGYAANAATTGYAAGAAAEKCGIRAVVVRPDWVISVVDLDVQVELVHNGLGRDGSHLFSHCEVAEVCRVCSLTGGRWDLTLIIRAM